MTAAQAAAVCCALLWAEAANGDPAIFAERAGYIPGAFIHEIGPGALLWVDRMGKEPGCVEVLCGAHELVGQVSLESSQVLGAQYTAQADESPLSSLGDTLHEINRQTNHNLITQLTLSVSEAKKNTLPDVILASPLSQAHRNCRIRLVNALHRRPPERGQPVIMTSDLRATLTVQINWSVPLLPAVERLMVTHWLAQYLPINGGNIEADSAVGRNQRLGWQHDQGSLLHDITAGARSRRVSP